jgi:hypothetical protein
MSFNTASGTTYVIVLTGYGEAKGSYSVSFSIRNP